MQTLIEYNNYTLTPQFLTDIKRALLTQQVNLKLENGAL